MGEEKKGLVRIVLVFFLIVTALALTPALTGCAIHQLPFGEYDGVGILITSPAFGHIVAAGVVKDSPADKAGIMPGDEITKINDESVSHLSFDQVVDKLSGEPGSFVYVEYRFQMNTWAVRLQRVHYEVNKDGLRFGVPK